MAKRTRQRGWACPSVGGMVAGLNRMIHYTWNQTQLFLYENPDLEFKVYNVKVTSLAIQWLRLWVSTEGSKGSIPGWETKIPYAMQRGKKKKKSKSVSTALERVSTAGSSDTHLPDCSSGCHYEPQLCRASWGCSVSAQKGASPFHQKPSSKPWKAAPSRLHFFSGFIYLMQSICICWFCHLSDVCDLFVLNYITGWNVIVVKGFLYCQE